MLEDEESVGGVAIVGLVGKGGCTTVIWCDTEACGKEVFMKGRRVGLEAEVTTWMTGGAMGLVVVIAVSCLTS